jgi:hypothetical protein
VQEFVLARELEIFTGSCSFSYELFSEAVRGVGALVDRFGMAVLPGTTPNQELATAVTLIRDLVRIREQRQVAELGWRPLPTLYQCYYISRNRKSSIIHDQLYGVLGLAGNNLSIKVDYTYPIARLWLDLILKSLEVGDLLPLHHAGLSQGSGINMHMTQSFIPPFEALGIKSALLIGKPAFCAGHGTIAKVEVRDLGLVKIRSIIIDTITNVTLHTKEPKISPDWCGANQKYSQFIMLTCPISPYRIEDSAQILMRTYAGGVVKPVYKDKDKNRDRDSYLEWVAISAQNMYCRVIFSTRKGYIGLGPYGMQEGDEVVIFDGADTPFVLRADKSGYDRWKLVGECYLDGWMYVW